MARLVDTNLLLRSVQPSHPMHAVAVRALERLMAQEEALYITIQNVAEFWNAATRPIAQNGLGLSVEQARKEIDRLEEFFEILSESISSYEEWKMLLSSKRVSGTQAHDARLVAVMRVNGIAKIVTFNVQDFTRFDGIEAVHPADVNE
jgi:predicted nucleic acid-binding protein